MRKAQQVKKAETKNYIVLIPFPWENGHWTSVKQILKLTKREAASLLLVGRIKLETPGTAQPKKKTETDAYTVLVPFPWKRGKFTEKGQVINLTKLEAQKWLLSGHIEIKKVDVNNSKETASK